MGASRVSHWLKRQRLPALLRVGVFLGASMTAPILSLITRLARLSVVNNYSCCPRSSRRPAGTTSELPAALQNSACRDGVRDSIHGDIEGPFSVEDNIRPNNCTALAKRHHGGLFNLIKRVVWPALGDNKASRCRGLKHACYQQAMQSVECFTHHRAQLSAASVCQPLVSNVWLSLPK